MGCHGKKWRLGPRGNCCRAYNYTLIVNICNDKTESGTKNCVVRLNAKLISTRSSTHQRY